MNCRHVVILLAVLLALTTEIPFSQAIAQTTKNLSNVVLRDLTVIPDVTVTEFDASGVILSNGKNYGWDEILTADLADDRKSEFKEFQTSIGEPLFRLKTRLRNQDWRGAGELAATHYKHVRDEDHINKQMNFLVCLAEMRGKIAEGDRAGGVEPFLLATTAQRQLEEQSKTELTDLLLDAEDAKNRLSGEIMPLWFDKASVRRALDSLSELVDSGRITVTRGASIYLASLAIANEDFLEADRIVSGLRASNNLPINVEKWLTVVEIERYLAGGEDRRAELLITENFDSYIDGQRAAVFYLRGNYAQENSEKKIIWLLTVPALFGERFPNLSATALFQASTVSEKKGEAKEARILRNELLRRYPNTYHGRLAEKAQN